MRALLPACLAFSIATAWTTRPADLRGAGEPAVKAAPGGPAPVPDRPEQPEAQPPALVASGRPPLPVPMAQTSGAHLFPRGELPGFRARVYRPPIPVGR